MGNIRPSDFCAFILTAGEGRRLKPYTDHMPKPMVPILDKPILEHTLNNLNAVGIRCVTLNTFYKKDVIHRFIESYQTDIDIQISEEHDLLNTGLGMKTALSNMQKKPFFAINGDAFWIDRSENESVFEDLSNAWQPEKMDILLLLQPINKMSLTKGVGDYKIDKNGKAIRQLDQSGDYMFAGIRICKPEIFENTPDTPFSFLELMDKAESEGRLNGLVYTGDWHHISTPQDLDNVNSALRHPVQKEVVV